MSILGINNRTENWKTARHFHPFFGDAGVELAERLGEPKGTAKGEVQLELYWKGMRDHLHDCEKENADNELAERYECLFPDLRNAIKDFEGLRLPNGSNYRVDATENKSKFRNNLINTEIDIVLASPGHLYIGEAKHEMSFGADGNLILVHQLIRQYVMAKILLDIRGCTKKVIPFVVGDNAKRLRKSRQVAFMIDRGWMCEKNVLKWREIQDLARDVHQ